jgi:hypothetical protein
MTLSPDESTMNIHQVRQQFGAVACRMCRLDFNSSSSSVALTKRRRFEAIS